MALFQFNNYIKRPKLAELITIWRQPLPPTLHYFWKGTLSINFVSTVQVKAQPGCYICCLALLQLWHFVNLLEGQTAFYAVCDPAMIQSLTFRELTWGTTCFFAVCDPAMIQSLTFRELTWGTTCFLCRLWPCYDPVSDISWTYLRDNLVFMPFVTLLWSSLWHFVNLLEGQPAFYTVCDPAMIQSLTFRELTWGTTCFLCRLWPCYDTVKYSPRSSYISNIHLNNIFWIHIGNQKLFSSGTLTKGLYTFLFPPY